MGRRASAIRRLCAYCWTLQAHRSTENPASDSSRPAEPARGCDPQLLPIRSERTSGGRFRSLLQALANERRPIPAHYLGFIGLSCAFEQPELLGASLFGNLAKFRRDSVRVDELFGKARAEPQSSDQQRSGIKRQSDGPSTHYRPPRFNIRNIDCDHIITPAGIQYEPRKPENRPIIPFSPRGLRSYHGRYHYFRFFAF